MPFLATLGQISVQFLSGFPQLVLLLLDTLGIGSKALKVKQPKVILITGATSGIGENLALYYAAPDVTLVLTGRNAEALTKITEACRAKGAAVIPKQIDVVNKHGMAHFIAEVDDRTPLDMVIANAGVTEETIGTRADLEASAYKVFETNVAGVFNTIFPALSGMQKRGSGQIVLMSSLAGNGAISGSAAYASSKAAVRIWGESARYQLARDGIAVNIVTPGYVASPMTQANKFQMSNVVTMDYAVKQITQGLAKNEALIAFPAATLIQTWFLGSLPSQIKDWIARNRLIGVISYWRRKPAAKKEAKKE